MSINVIFYMIKHDHSIEIKASSTMYWAAKT